MYSHKTPITFPHFTKIIHAFETPIILKISKEIVKYSRGHMNILIKSDKQSEN